MSSSYIFSQILVYYCLGVIFVVVVFCFNDTATTENYTYCHTLSLHDALPFCGISRKCALLAMLLSRSSSATIRAMAHLSHRPLSRLTILQSLDARCLDPCFTSCVFGPGGLQRSSARSTRPAMASTSGCIRV